ncbi:uncharacterized protein AC631_05210 [Debaryomyces fabryi]|uniref:CCR4-Not complex component Not N-terminal domain-containing protein n=1 Tax=Debaryomyces fabryi TaxID=58627 RepID=A0A0V1PSN9_9ASCO|nr:uncharacterized protein AC631_05210 [Debaryomyces fabryi]KRZ99022.1 hypothetical protein AC631_05210 [Debaryomyces fabryi]
MLAALELEEIDLSPEAEEAVGFLETSIEELEDQCEKLEGEYEKISQKKIRKNNLTMIEERKQEIEGFSNRNKFHIEKMEMVIDFLKKDKISPDAVFAIQEDITFYLESNQEPDFIDDDTLYDELIKEASKSSNNDNINDENSQNDDISFQDQSSSNKEDVDEVNVSTPIKKSADQLPTSSLHSRSDNSPQTHPDTSSTPQKAPLPIPSTPELSSPAIIKSLKPATTPSKPVGNLKWAVAAAGSAPSTSNGIGKNGDMDIKPIKEEPVFIQSQNSRVPSNKLPFESQFQSQILPEPTNHPEPQLESQFSVEKKSNDPNYKFVEVLQNSSVSNTELELFSDLNLIKLPPGIQDLAISFTATRKVSTNDSKILINTNAYNPYITPIQKPFLPLAIQATFNHHLPNNTQEQRIKAPLHLLKFQSYWNRIRAENQFDQFVKEIQLLSAQNNADNVPVINELTMVLFYGYYYGFTPIENLIAESCLFKLNWKPYGSRSEIQNNLRGTNQIQDKSPFDKMLFESKHYYYWFKCVRNTPTPQVDANEYVEHGDYQVFDLITWETYIKYGYRLELNLCQLEPSKTLF